MSRVALGLKNTKISFLFYFALLLLSFFSRKIFIDTLGVELVGLNTLMTNILSVMNLSELGIGTAVAATMYKPLFDDSKKEISDIVSVLGYVYRIVGYIIIGIGLLILLILPLLLQDKGVSLSWGYIAFGGFFLLNLIPYFISYQQAILSADQRQYEVTAATNILVIVRVSIQIVLLKYFGFGYITWLLIEVVFSLILGLWLVFRVKRLYPWLEVSIDRGKQIKKYYLHIFKAARQIIPHRISGSVLTQTDTIILTILTSLQSVTLYTNYSMLMSKSVTLVSTSFFGLMAGVGSLIAQGNVISVKKLFWEFNAIFLTVGAVFAIGLYYISSPFVSIWLGVEFVLDQWIVLFLTINTFLSIIRIPLVYFVNGYLLFKDTWAPICEIFINLIISFVLAYYLGIVGVMIGTAVSVTFMQIWKPYFFYREIFKESVWRYWSEVSKYIFAIVVAWSLIHFIFVRNGIYMPLDTYIGLIINSASILVIVLVTMIFSLFFFSNGMRDVVGRALSILLKR